MIRKRMKRCKPPPATNDEVVRLLRILIEKVTTMANEIDRVFASVTKINTRADSMIALLNQLSQLIRDNANNPAKLNQIADDLDAKSDQADAAITANTPPTA